MSSSFIINYTRELHPADIEIDTNRVHYTHTHKHKADRAIRIAKMERSPFVVSKNVVHRVYVKCFRFLAPTIHYTFTKCLYKGRLLGIIPQVGKFRLWMTCPYKRKCFVLSRPPRSFRRNYKIVPSNCKMKGSKHFRIAISIQLIGDSHQESLLSIGV